LGDGASRYLFDIAVVNDTLATGRHGCLVRKLRSMKRAGI